MWSRATLIARIMSLIEMVFIYIKKHCKPFEFYVYLFQVK